MKETFFKNISVGGAFVFGDLCYIKISEEKALSFAGVRVFNLMEIVSK